MRPRFTATSVPPLSGGPDLHDSEATHALTIADSAGGRPAGGRAVKHELSQTA
jgi:hypothetical protein